MRSPLVLCSLIVFCVTAAAQSDDYRTLNDCMAGEFETSIQACTRLIERGGYSATHAANLYTLRGQALAEARNHEKAIADFDKAIELAPQSYCAHALRSDSYKRMGQHDRAHAAAERTLALGLWKEHQRSRDAIQHYCVGSYDLAIKGDPRLAAAYVKRGINFWLHDKFNAAIADFDKAIELDPQFSPAYYERGYAHKRAGTLDKAFADYDRAIALNPRYSLAYMARAVAYLTSKGEYDHAIADLDKAIEINPRLLLAYHNRGVAYFKKDEYDRAIADFSKTVEINPKGTLGYHHRGLAYEKKDDKHSAIIDYRRVLAIEPWHYGAKFNLKRLGVEP